ncbi:MAG: hypothetical protein GY822_24115 [Deltaproteobacteria bacterium]|nr:hypothetical protein [Deltaproteobacteria bacterium]
MAALVEQVSAQEVAASDEQEQRNTAQEKAKNLQDETEQLAKEEEAKLKARVESLTHEVKQKESIQLEATQKLVATEQTIQQTMQQMQERADALQKEKVQAVKEALDSLKGEKKSLEQAFVRADDLKEQVENRLLTMDVEVEEYQDDIKGLKDALNEKDVELRQERMLRVEERESMLQEIRDAKARAS